MPIVANPPVLRFSIPVASGKIVLILRSYTTQEYVQFMSRRFALGASGKVADISMQARVEFVDSLLIGIEALDKDGQPDDVVYAVDGQLAKLTPQVNDWIGYINPSWKLPVAYELESLSAQIEDGAIKK